MPAQEALAGRANMKKFPQLDAVRGLAVLLVLHNTNVSWNLLGKPFLMKRFLEARTDLLGLGHWRACGRG